MNPINPGKFTRREFLRVGAQLGIAGAATPLALTLASIGQAAAATVNGDYKALVCVFLYGGNDYGNTLVPYDAASHKAYAAIRQSLATPRDSLAATALTPKVALPDATRQMALAPELAALKPLFDQGKMGVLLNIGALVQPVTLAHYKAGNVPLPPKLFSHNDQQSYWQSSLPEGSTSGWGGRIGDLFLQNNTTSTFTCMNVSGNAVYMSGNSAVQYQISSSGAVALRAKNSPVYGSSSVASALQSLIRDSSSSNLLEQEHARIVLRALDSESKVTSALASTPALTTNFDTSNSLAMQLRMVARLIAARSQLGAARQVFFVSLGGFDTHDYLVTEHPDLLTKVGNALASFQAATEELGVARNVTAFTASDFGRTLSSNGDGSDHGWGSYHFVLGGAVNGGRYFGTLPAVAVNGPDDVGQGRLLPTTGVDQLAATLATWMGVSASEMPLVVPNIRNYSVTDLGLLN